jgi:hypothetical protein
MILLLQIPDAMKNSFTQLVNAVFLFFILLINTQTFALTTTCISSGNWSNSGTWDNGVPTSSDDVVVPSGYTVTMDGIGAQCFLF